MTVARRIIRQVAAILPQPCAELIRALRRRCRNRQGSERIFARIHARKGWQCDESVSGPGSTLKATRNAARAIREIIADRGICSITDIPCGDAYWMMRTIPNSTSYFGGDIVPELVADAAARFGDRGLFAVCDLTKSDMPYADLIVVRDCLIHLPNNMACRALANICRSGGKYILTTTFPNADRNIDIEIGGFRPINLNLPPFSLPEPLAVYDDFDGVNCNGKSLALYRVATIDEHKSRLASDVS